MLIAELKAMELYNKYLPLVQGGYLNETYRDKAKKCATIHAMEIVSELEQLRKPEYTTFVLKYATCNEESETMDGFNKIDYWNEVIDEIGKII